MFRSFQNVTILTTIAFPAKDAVRVSTRKNESAKFFHDDQEVCDSALLEKRRSCVDSIDDKFSPHEITDDVGKIEKFN